MAFDASVVCPLATIKATLVPYGGHRVRGGKYLIRRAHTKGLRGAWSREGIFACVLTCVPNQIDRNRSSIPY